MRGGWQQGRRKDMKEEGLFSREVGGDWEKRQGGRKGKDPARMVKEQ